MKKLSSLYWHKWKHTKWKEKQKEKSSKIALGKFQKHSQEKIVRQRESYKFYIRRIKSFLCFPVDQFESIWGLEICLFACERGSPPII